MRAPSSSSVNSRQLEACNTAHSAAGPRTAATWAATFRNGLQQQCRQLYRSSQRSGHVLRAAAEAAPSEEEDLWQIADRDNWYLPKWAADDAPDWNPARFVRSAQLAPGLREVVLDIEISRAKVPLRNAYRHVGQRAMVRVNSGEDRELAVACAPFEQVLNKDALVRLRGDIRAGETKVVKEEISVRAELSLLVGEGDAPEVYNMGDDDLAECGPFQGAGLDLRGPISGIYVFPTIVIFCEGTGIAAARALIEACPDVGGLSFPLRADVRMYYRAPNQASLCYNELFDTWRTQYGVQVTTATRDSFQDMFDDDDTLVYEPSQTAAIILTGGDEESEAEALEACAEAEISEVVRQSVQAVQTIYLTKGVPDKE